MEVLCNLLLLVLDPRLLLLRNGEKGVCDKKRAYSDPYLRVSFVQVLGIKEEYYKNVFQKKCITFRVTS
jgi:hypothetical protein